MEDDGHAASSMIGIKLESGLLDAAPIDADRSVSAPTSNARNCISTSPPASLDGLKSRSDGADQIRIPAEAKPPPPSRKPSHPKTSTRDPPLYSDLPEVTADSCKTFQLIPDCLYGSKHLGSTDNDAFDCDCREEWNDGENLACGDDSDCINRATKMECGASGGHCGGGCQNQRFQRKQWASVSVIRTDKKGYGLRSDNDLGANDFVYEYIGEVINEPTFRRRMLQYDREGIKHFYFMSLSKGEFVDATKKGNLGRFCNHSCNPNCYVDKWVVGDKLRMGIFTLRKIRAGEELVFNYNVDRYGADPQPCYCGEPNCVGFIGGKTQTGRATKLPAAVVEALGIDGPDGWDTAVSRRPRRKRPDEDDEAYVNSIQPRGLDEDDARKVMAALVQCKEKWIVAKLLERIRTCEEERVIHCVMRMHAYPILKTILNSFTDDANLVLQVLDILDSFPRLTRNKIQDSKIEASIETLAASEDDVVASKSAKLLGDWRRLQVAYRIRRRKLDPNAPPPQTTNLFEDRRGGQVRDDEASQSTPGRAASPRPLDAPRGPRNSGPPRSGGSYFHASYGNARQRRPPPALPLPDGWFSAKDGRGNVYFYTRSGKTTWQRPSQPDPDRQPRGPSKALQEQLAIQSIIDKVTKEGTPKQAGLQVTDETADLAPRRESTRKDKWRSLPLEKQMKIYENTVFPPVKHVLDKFRHKLPKDELKRLGREIAKKLVASDYKNKRVEDPTAALTDRQVSKIKKYVADFLNRAVEKYEAHKKRKALRQSEESPPDGRVSSRGGVGDNEHKAGSESAAASPGRLEEEEEEEEEEEAGEGAGEEGNLTEDDDDDDDDSSPDSRERKRKREAETVDSSLNVTPSEVHELKRVKEDEGGRPSPPPPPPPPPERSADEGAADERQALREQEEELMRENEEAQRLEDEANETKKMEETTDELRKKEVALAAA